MKNKLIDELYLLAKTVRLSIEDCWRWRGGQNRENCGKPRVYYGVAQLPEFSAAVSGGIVKCFDLARVYPNTSDCPNILYLVSSALPPNGPYLAALARKKGIKVMVNQNGVAYPAWHGPGWEKTNNRLRQVLSSADYVIYQSGFCKRAADRFLGPVTVPWKTLHNPVATDTLKVTINSRRGSRRLLVAGTHNSAYRVQLAVATLGNLCNRGIDVVLDIAGPLAWSREPKEAERQVDWWSRDYGVKGRVNLLGPYCQQDVNRIFEQVDVLLHLQYNDVCPRLLVESMACGVPVVFSGSGGSPELVGEEGGIGLALPESFDQLHFPEVNAIADAVKTIFEDYKGFSMSARQRAVRLFDVKYWLSQHAIIFGELLQ